MSLPEYLQDAVADRLGLAQSIAYSMWRKTSGANSPLDELQSQAYLGLVIAANNYEPYCERNKFDPRDLSYFSYYASLRIRGEIVEYLRSLDWATRTTRARAQMLQAISEVEAENLSDEELADRSGLSVKQVRKALTAADNGHHPMSLEMLEKVSESSLSLRVQAPEALRFEQELISSAMEFFEDLDQDILLILSLHYYINLDLHEIATLLGKTDVSVSKLHSTAILNLHEHLSVLAL